MSKNKIAYILLFFLLLPSLGFSIGGMFLPVLFMIEFLFIFSLFITNRQFLNDVIILFTKKPCLYLLLFFIWASITLVISIFRGTFYSNAVFNSYIGGLLLSVFAPLIISYFINKKFLTPQNFIKFYLFICFFIFLFGIVEFILRQINLDWANAFVSLFNNRRNILYPDNLTKLLIERIKSIFGEPSKLGEFIYLNIPIVYSLCLSKYKIFKNNIINRFIKSLTIPLMLICLVLSKSPISLIFVLIITLIYFHKSILKLIIKSPAHLLFIVVSILLLFFLLFFESEYLAVNIQTSYLKRIFETIPSLFSINALIAVEPSLATRIINYANNLQVFFDNPFCGVGYGNMSKYILVQMKTSNLPLTLELWKNLNMGEGNVASAIFYRVMAETGFIGYICLFLFMFKTYCLNKLLLRFSVGLEKDFLNGINLYLLIFMTFVCFYNSNLHNTYYWLVFGFIYAYQYRLQNMRRE